MTIHTELDISAHWREKVIPKFAEKLAIGQTGKLAFAIDGVVYFVWVTREAEAECRVASDKPLPSLPRKDDSWGAPLWRKMHEGMLTLATPAEREQRVNEIHALLPCGPCKGHFSELRRETPADYRTADSAFASSWRWQNAVRKKQGKPEMGLAEARALYAPMV